MASSSEDPRSTGAPTAQETAPASDAGPAAGGPRTAAPKRTRAGAAWVGITIAALLLVLLIVFIAQNNRSVRISFLWLDGSFPLGLALLVAAVGGALVAIIAGSTRILQLRQAMARRRRRG